MRLCEKSIYTSESMQYINIDIVGVLRLAFVFGAPKRVTLLSEWVCS